MLFVAVSVDGQLLTHPLSLPIYIYQTSNPDSHGFCLLLIIYYIILCGFYLVLYSFGMEWITLIKLEATTKTEHPLAEANETARR